MEIEMDRRRRFAAETSRIGWCHFTLNLWRGCSEVSPGCANCYARSWIEGRAGGRWSDRAFTPETSVDQRLSRWSGWAVSDDFRAWAGLRDGERPKVFVGSLMDWAEGSIARQTVAVRRLFELIRRTPDLDFLLLTKRPQNVPSLLPADWGDGWPNVWMMTSVESGETRHRDRLLQAPVLRRAYLLLEIPAVVRGVSYEPALGPLAEEIEPLLGPNGISWVIYGGESGPSFRCDGESGDRHAWSRPMKQACAVRGAAFYHKQIAARRQGVGSIRQYQDVPASVPGYPPGSSVQRSLFGGPT